ncbi:sensor histidine kinase [Virgibacillus halodenitrificans]|uniref:sensor histidine kinase n=1 Tax=Virgibacillus halodenitrificans TaxID=1482 RepID=UPI001F1863C5|nr:sensor histidine kinase [Virgibacillus halodenitrificans]MCG1028115.1 sensor histidine kinase [Virgibacillus halodenitrificans]
MKTIRGKLTVYFLVFIILFQVTAISIFVSSNQLTNTYHDSFEQFLLLNSVAQKSEELYLRTKTVVTNADKENQASYFKAKKLLQKDKDRLTHLYADTPKIEIKNYMNLLETFIYESELTVGFTLQDDIEQYTTHLEETRITASYIQAAALEIIDVELTDYQAFYQNLQVRNNHFFVFIAFLFITTMMLAIFFALWFSRGITRPVQQLSHAAKQVAAGELRGEPVHIHTNDELKLLGDTFNHMRANIDELVTEIKDQSELDRLIKEMELKHLQNQINPHFLFNTLNTISKMAFLEDARSTSNLIDAVAALLRHSLGQIDKSVPLADEVAVVEDYFHIQKVRFSERVEFVLEMDEACLDIELPKLSLQPLVENAFIHGIEEKEDGGRISLHIYPSPTTVFVEVKDDGKGMSRERVQQILSMSEQELPPEEHEGHSTGLGLSNVIRRLQLFYQRTDVVEIESLLGEGTTIRLLLPKQKGES